MIPIGSTVKINGLPFYGIGTEYANTNFVVVLISENHYRLSNGRVALSFPIGYEEMLVVVDENSWNKLGYISPFKPLKLP